MTEDRTSSPERGLHSEALRLAAPLSALILVVLACGPGKGGSVGDTEATTTTVGSSGATTGATTDGATTDALSCDMFVPADDLGPPVAITLKHQGSAAIFIGAAGCAGLPRISIIDPNLQSIDHYGGDCWPTQCQDFLGLDDCTLGCDDCAGPSLLRVEPGASATLLWPGVIPTPMQMTTECAPGTECQRECLLGLQAPAATYSVAVEWTVGCTGDCECDAPAPNGICPLWEAPQPGTWTSITTELVYPDMTAVELVITD